jgi:hypothetical protein
MPRASNVKPCFPYSSSALENDIYILIDVSILTFVFAGVVQITTLCMGKLSQLPILDMGLEFIVFSNALL